MCLSCPVRWTRVEVTAKYTTVVGREVRNPDQYQSVPVMTLPYPTKKQSESTGPTNSHGGDLDYIADITSLTFRRMKKKSKKIRQPSRQWVSTTNTFPQSSGSLVHVCKTRLLKLLHSCNLSQGTSENNAHSVTLVQRFTHL